MQFCPLNAQFHGLYSQFRAMHTQFHSLHTESPDSHYANPRILYSYAETGVGKRSNKAELQNWAQKASINADKVQYTAEFKVSKAFGMPGAITIINNHQNELFVETIAIKGLPMGTVYFSCYSWVQSKYNNPKETIFFTNQAYLPSETPAGLKDLRTQDMASFRGDGKGTRKAWERVYDYDVYNDVGNPDKSKDLARPTLGGNGKLQYPRRCRTGRPPTKAGEFFPFNQIKASLPIALTLVSGLYNP